MKYLNFIFFFIIFTSCNSLSTRKLEKLLHKNETELKEVANRFLNQNAIEYISIGTEYDSAVCQSVNRWLNCPSQGPTWHKYSPTIKGQMYVNSIDEVLQQENIDSKSFYYFHDFLRRNKLESISRGYFPCKNCVEFGSFLTGLRYYTVRPNDLKENHEYLYVKRINENWFVFKRDWN